MTMPGTRATEPGRGGSPTMRAVVYHGPGSVRVDEVELPRIQHPRDVIVRVTRTAVCGTDLHPYRGELPGFAPGTVLGHEFAGTVHEAGSQAPFAVGTRVFASDVVACGRCAACARGWHYQCPSVTLFGYADVVGAPLPGGQAEFVRVPFADVVLAATPDDVTDEQALFAGDVLTTGLAAVHGARVTPGALVAVVGAGPLGLLAGLCAVTAGAARVVIADPTPARRERAAGFGFTAVTPEQLDEAVRDDGGRGADAVVEAVGSDAALACALRAAAAHATVCAVGAHHSTAMPFPTGLAFARELTVRFAVGDPIRMREPVLALIRSGRLDPSRIVTHRLPLGEAGAAYRLFDRQDAFKVVLSADGATPAF
ncbi:alcohol dehydrogenase catalytic domain-containing protein [Micromonospora sp. WMMD1082]|uniref:alcohol dehydrogenase catalytic domain-containing protein n=1 Tax=Micromonospora sp. WMMD1082 TaxID=3016104 RepID=UPI002416C909|nr:alcohol dehydrogenase catalytic domain-containing protein [Micromonospora sp. WMMD1082]MDG4792822.1 alcohol dehydrogenase catalytic domain-containing protein [Micromonospora sp. WMMD1082]